MARLVLLACLMLGVVSVSASNRLDVEHCSEDCTKHCGKRTRYITDKCVETATGSYKAMCTPGGAWKIENYLEKGCKGNKEGNDMESDNTCLPSPNKLPVKYVSYNKEEKQVTVKICGKIPNGDTEDCAADTCEEKKLSTTPKCAKVEGMPYYYTVAVTGDDDSATATLALYDDAQLCEAAVSPAFYKENMKKDECATDRQALKGTCTPITRTKTVPPPPTTSNTTTSSSTTTTSTDATTNNTTTDGEPSSAVCGSLATALLAVLAVLVALY